MDNIGKFLEKFRSIKNDDILARDRMVEYLFSVLGIKIDKTGAKINRKIAYLKISGPARSEIIIKKRKIIDEVNGSLGFEAIREIV